MPILYVRTYYYDSRVNWGHAQPCKRTVNENKKYTAIF